MRVQRHASGSVRYDKRRKTWNYLWYDGQLAGRSELDEAGISNQGSRMEGS